MSTSESIDDVILRLESIIDIALDGIITINDKGVMESINNTASGLFGYNVDELIGQNVRMLMPEPVRTEHDGYISSYVRTRQAKIIGIGREVIGKRKDGIEFPFRLEVGEVILNDRVIFTGIIHDLTDVKSAEAKLSALNKSLEAQVNQRTQELEDVVNKLLETNTILEEKKELLTDSLQKERELGNLKSRFVSLASHEFRTPLSSILSSASLIAKYPLEHQQENREKHIQRIKSSVNHLTGILNDFLSLSKLEEGMLDLQESRFDLVEMVQVVENQLRPILKSGQKVVYHIVPTPFEITSDRKILRNILFNLLSNAIKYSPVHKEIICSIILENDSCKIKVKDQGIGIPQKDQKYLFDRFFRASNVETIQGTGLGLNIMKRYVEMLGGSIGFTSDEGIGTEFIVDFKISK